MYHKDDVTVSIAYLNVLVDMGVLPINDVFILTLDLMEKVYYYEERVYGSRGHLFYSANVGRNAPVESGTTERGVALAYGVDGVPSL